MTTLPRSRASTTPARARSHSATHCKRLALLPRDVGRSSPTSGRHAAAAATPQCHRLADKSHNIINNNNIVSAWLADSACRLTMSHMAFCLRDRLEAHGVLLARSCGALSFWCSLFPLRSLWLPSDLPLLWYLVGRLFASLLSSPTRVDRPWTLLATISICWRRTQRHAT